MADPSQNNDNSWRVPQFRQKVVAQIEDAMRQSNNTMSKSSSEMESHMYAKAKTRDEYLGFVARLIIHVRDAGNKRGGVGPGGQGGPVMGGPGMQDPLGALKNLTATPNLQPGMPGQPQPHQGMAPGMGGPQRPFNTYQQPGMPPQGMPQRGPPPHMQPPGMQQGPRAMDPFNSMGGMQPGGPQPGMGGPMQQPQPHATMQPMQQQPGMGATMGQPQPSPVMQGGLAAQSPGSIMSQPSPGMGMGPSPGQAGVGAPSPGGPLNTPGNPYQMGLTSPAQVNNLPTLQPNKVDDPEEKRYLEKLKQLAKYVEPLKRMIRRIEHDEDRKKDQTKMKNLLDILLDTKRMPFSGLIKCEEVLKKLDPEFQKYPGSTGVPTSTTATSSSSSSGLPDKGYVPSSRPGDPICQTLLDTLANHIKSPVLNHTLQRTFGPAMQAINGPPARSHSPPAKRIRRFPSPGPRDVPAVLQGEIARLSHQFKVSLDPLHHSGSSTVHLIAKIDDKHLPTVPPISLSVPENYPKASPTWEPTPDEYEATPFLQRVEKNLSQQIVQLPDRYSVTALLNTWEMSIRRACAPALATAASL